MSPSIPLPTDNLYKFTCLFGLTLIVTAIFAFVSTYATSLDRKIKFSEVVIALEAKADRTKSEDDILALNKQLIEITRSNEKVASNFLGATLGVGISLSLFGAGLWYKKIQIRDDKIAQLQLEKMVLEIAALQREATLGSAPPEPILTERSFGSSGATTSGGQPHDELSPLAEQ